MLDRAWLSSFRRDRDGRHVEGRGASRFAVRPTLEGLEGRQLLAASIGSIADVTVPAQVGYQVPVDGGASGATSQTFAVTSSNPDIKATVAQGHFVTVNVTHSGSGAAADPTFSGTFTYELFNDLTPKTATRIEEFTNGALPGVTGSYNGTQFFRVVKNFDPALPSNDPTNTVVQGGPQGATGSGTNPLELNQQLVFGEPGSVAIANAGANTDGQQFFITTGPQPNLNFGYTIFGQVVSGQNVVGEIGQVATQDNGSGEISSPLSPVTITSSTVSANNPNGVIHIDATGAKAGETSTITVAATDPATGTTATRTFRVTVGAAATVPTTATFAPVTVPPASLTQSIQPGQTATFSTPVVANNATNNPAVTTALTLVTPPSHGSVVFNQATHKAVYTPTAGFTGTDSFAYRAVNTNTTTGADPVSANGNTVNLSVSVGSAGPVSQPVSQPVLKNTPTTVTLNFAGATAGVTTTVAIVTPPKHGTLSAINTTTNTVVYTPAAGFTGLDGFTYQATNTNSTTNPPAVTPGNVAAVSLGVGTPTNTVRRIGNVLVVTPLPRTDKGTNTIVVSQAANPADPAVGDIQVTVNGVLDLQQPQTVTNDTKNGVSRVIVFGSKADDAITVAPTVDPAVAVTLDGGHGGANTLQGGAGSTLEHGWFGQNTLSGGTGANQLIGRAGHVKFRPTTATNEIFAGNTHPGYHYESFIISAPRRVHPTPGTFYKFVHGRTVAIPTPKANAKQTTTITTNQKVTTV